MKLMTDRIITTHAGSLPRPAMRMATSQQRCSFQRCANLRKYLVWAKTPPLETQPRPPTWSGLFIL
jgi:hypothetical protein